ncbi:hypothetical protein L873DRAFT_1339084 [Choiromyces venosus 120613-1]|uniref:Uncharacterized protein n=1 Tax=Choiromyces venosus 120613-1 TaxID=1336337 RepID=A0A3N4JA78_9PEZI|nr:hypothetical protein L873DRAFT_1339084 [Choiromyces venosus 120613-1]
MEREKKREKKKKKKKNSEEWEKSYTRDDLPSASMVSPPYGIFLSYKFPPCPLINIYPSSSPLLWKCLETPINWLRKPKTRQIHTFAPPFSFYSPTFHRRTKERFDKELQSTVDPSLIDLLRREFRRKI